MKKRKSFKRKALAAIYSWLVQISWSCFGLPSSGTIARYHHTCVVNWYCLFSHFSLIVGVLANGPYNRQGKKPQLSSLPILRTSYSTIFDGCSWSTPHGLGLLILRRDSGLETSSVYHFPTPFLSYVPESAFSWLCRNHTIWINTYGHWGKCVQAVWYLVIETPSQVVVESPSPSVAHD